MLKKLLFASTASLGLAACGTIGEDKAIATAEAFAIEAADAMAEEALASNPLYAEWTGPYDGVPPWEAVTPEHVTPAYEAAIAEYLADVDAIAANPDAPTFDNTIVALELAGPTLERVNAIFGVMSNNVSTPAIQQLQQEWGPKLAAAYDEVNFNSALFARIANLYERRNQLGLEPDQLRLLTRYYEGYVRSGAQLDADGKAQLAAYNQQLAQLFAKFSANLLADEQQISFATADEMAGVPADVRNAAASVAEGAGQAGQFGIRNTRSMAQPVLTFAQDRALRERVWRAFVNRGDNGGATDNNAIIAQIVKLRAERAKLLGYQSHAHWRMQDTMAGTPDRAMDLMMRVWPAAVDRVEEEVADMMEFARADGLSKIEPWDYRYYMEKVRKAKYDLSQEEVKPYFALDNMVEGMFWMAGELYGLEFTENTGSVPVFDPDVRTFEVTNRRTGELVGLFYFDTYARQGKRSGAWAGRYKGSDGISGTRYTLASNNNNFTKPAPGQPVLISLDDAATLFHEFGHGLHTLLTDVRYPSFRNAQRDFVEYPSQVHENWLLSEPVMQRFARHYETGEPIPQELLDKIDASSTFNEGFDTVEYLSSALVDMLLHIDPDGDVDADAFEREALAQIGMPEEIVMRHRLPQFGHLFASDAYSAGYYSYLWSEVMDADTWAAFEERGNVFDPELAERYRIYILGTGNAMDRAEAYRQFRGRDPEVDALLERRGFPTGTAE